MSKPSKLGNKLGISSIRKLMRPRSNSPSITNGGTPPTGSSQSSSTIQSNTSPKKVTWVVAIQNALGIVERAADVFPPFKSVVGGIKAILEAKDAFSDNQEEFAKLSARVKLVTEILQGRSEEDLPQDVRDRRDGLKTSIENLGRTLEEKTRRGNLERLAYTKEDQQDILRIVREITLAIEIAMLEVTVKNDTMILRAVKGVDWLKERTVEELRTIKQGIDAIAEGVAKLNKAELFNSLGDVKDFAFTQGGRRKGCVPGSRVTLLAELLAWAEDSASPHAFWLCGIAGVGKTAVTESFCLELSNRKMLGASFFCSLTSKDLSDVYLILPSLAKTLAKSRPEFGDALATVLEDMPGDFNPREMTLQQQYERLVVNPVESVLERLKQPIILCVDALDECVDTDALQELLDAIASRRPSAHLKVFMTSRPESVIKERIETPANAQKYHSLQLHDIERHIVQRDISLFIHRKLEKVSVLREHYRDAWPPPEVQKVVEQSGTLFIVAATIVRYIDNSRGDRIERFQSCGRVDAPLLSDIELLYRRILEAIFANLSRAEADDLHTCLSILVVAQRPLTVEQYAGLICCRVSRIEDLLRSLYSVVEVRKGLAVSIYHASFIDFLVKYHLVVNLTLPKQFPIDRVQANCMVANFCLDMLDSDDEGRGLYLGVSGAETSYKSNDDQPKTLQLRPDLAYACAAWVEHVRTAMPVGDALEARMRGFLEGKALYWLEALSVEKKVGTRSTSVMKDLAMMVRDEHLKRLLGELHTFSGTFSPPINHSAPHLYLSVLPFLHLTMDLSAWSRPALLSIPTIQNSGGAYRSRGRTLVHLGIRVNSVAVSPDGTKVASGDGAGAVQIWDILSGECVGGPMHAHPHSADCVRLAFSSDGSKIVSGYMDNSVLVWNLVDTAAGGGATSVLLDGHGAASVCDVAFSPDGSKVAFVSEPKTIQVWDTKRGEPAMPLLQGHEDDICSLAFSHDGSKIVSGSVDKTLRLWDTESGKPLGALLLTHTQPIISVAFSPDGTRIGAGTVDATILLWEAKGGSTRRLVTPSEGRNQAISSVAFSTDGLRIVSGSASGTLRVWDVASGKAIIPPLEGHLSDASVTFSPDGTKFVSGSNDGTIRVWEVEMEEYERDPLEGHNSEVNSTVFSPDGRKIVSGSFDNTIRIWDAGNGSALMSPLTGHTGRIESVAFSSDGSKIASTSEDGTIRVWDVESAVAISTIAVGHRVVCAAFSPRRSKTVAGGLDKEVRVWDAETGDLVMAALEGHMDIVTSVAFSPDGSRIASGSLDRSIRLWNAESGRVELVLSDKGSVVSVAFSPDGSKVASGSLDGPTRVWDAESGRLLATGPFFESAQVSDTLVGFSQPDGLRIVSARHKAIHICDTETGNLLMSPFEGHTSHITAVAFSPDGSSIVSSSYDHTIRLWDLEGDQTASPAKFLHNFPPNSTSFERDTGWLRNSDGDLLLWIPLDFRSSLHIQPLKYIIGGDMIEVELTNAVYHGVNWRRCKEPRREGMDDGEPWPVRY